MGKLTTTWCDHCNKETEQEWQVEPEDEGNPKEFYTLCLECGGFNYD